FEYIRPLTDEQLEVLQTACRDAEDIGLEFLVEKSDKKGRATKATVSQGKTKKSKLNTKKQLLKFISVAVSKF
ncbi:MAG: hypothetical protein PHR41_07260, partial [Lactococcus chungangensis]|nr:hypothetical protein [Lactococcus chungangensis]